MNKKVHICAGTKIVGTRIAHLLRVKHYIKNILVFFPMIFSGNLLNVKISQENILGFAAFSALASIIYIINDIMDIKTDRKHAIKKTRPLAAGTITWCQACSLVIVLVLLIVSIEDYLLGKGWIYLLIYFAVNIIYSLGAKNIPLLDVSLLVLGYLLRLLYGGAVSGVPVSNWMLLTVMSAAFYMGFGKRRNELIRFGSEYRKSLEYYTGSFLSKCCQVFITLTITFYSLTCVDHTTTVARSGIDFTYTIPFVVLILLRYDMILDSEMNDGDPVEVLLKDKIILALCILYGCIGMGLLYAGI